MKISKSRAAAAAILALSGAAQAALIDRGGGLIYDNTLNLIHIGRLPRFCGRQAGHAWPGAVL